MCVCDDGYLGNGDINCTDKDECALGEDNCATNAACLNTPGSYTCECRIGFTHELSDPTQLCLDLGLFHDDFH